MATRAAARASISQAIGELTAVEVGVLTSVALCGPATPQSLYAHVRAQGHSVDKALLRLESQALVWPSSSGWRALASVSDLLLGAGSAPAPCSVHPRSNAQIDTSLDQLSSDARALLGHLLDNGSHGTTQAAQRAISVEDAATPVEELLAHGLAKPTSTTSVVVPGEVALRFRGGFTTQESLDAAPTIAISERDQSVIDRAAAGAAYEVTQRVHQVLESWSDRPVTAVKSGGLPVREFRALNDMLHLEHEQTAFVVELAVATGLAQLGSTRSGEQAWMPTPRYDSWLQSDPAEQWRELVRAWWTTTRAPALAGSELGNRASNVLSPDLEAALLPRLRAVALRALADAGPDAVLASRTGVASLIEVMRWLRPGWPSTRDDATLWVVREAALLGLTGYGGPASWLHDVVAHDLDAAVQQIAGHLPQPVDQVLLQADLTAVAPGPLTADLGRSLRIIADLESHGGAAVFRFTDTSVRRALDAGWSAADLHDFVAGVAATPVPQSLTYLIDDSARQHGALRTGYAEAYFYADDPAQIAGLMSHARASEWGLRRIAPTVVIATSPIEDLLPALREAGFAPVAENDEGDLDLRGPVEHRARGRRTSPGFDAARQQASTTSIVAAIRAGDRAADARPAQHSSSTPSGALAMLQEAIEAQESVWIDYLDSHGSAGQRIITPRRLDGGHVTAYDHRADAERTFAVHRIAAVGKV